ncbi:nucleosome assembly protein 1-like 1 isoform X2 [Anneissia japonica]|uniref:nucleosome assembly protein 1-like 1 isoform X2 n=1 Tax=Anneissia japonica TaxID=1529436 RepID=UPI001425AB23|nr:nucleosome assembly protein 1-like 1 isoform X2 [Anneissia japonica]
MAENNQSADAISNMEAGPAGDSMEDVEDEEVGVQERVIDDKVNLVLQNPQVLASLQHQLDSLVGQQSGYIESLPKVVKRRIKALKKLQLNHTKLEAKFYEEVHQLECKYAKLYEGLYEKRKDVVTAQIEPTDSDCEWESSEDEEEEEEDNKLANELKEKAQLEDKEEENPPGIPEFWLTILKNVDLLADMVQEHDEPILKNLRDVKVKYCENPTMGFTLEFYFDENEYFTNQVLKKHYTMKCEPDESDPFSYEGPEIFSSVGCSIDWKKGKNVTVRLVKKKQKHKGKGTTRVVTKTEQNDSFFNFFNPPAVPEEGAEVDEETESLLSADFEIGHFFKERVVPRAVLYFTGEAIEDDFEEEGEDDDNEEEEDEDGDYDPAKDTKPSECKQQ